MTRLVVLGLAFLVVALCGVIAHDFTRAGLEEVDQLSAGKRHQASMGVSSGTRRQLKPWVSAILSRPLFEPSRRPLAPAAQPGTSGPGLPRLTGIVIVPNHREAIFAAPAPQKSIVVRAGSRLNGVLIKTIEAGAVVIVDASGTHVIHPSFDSATPRAAAPSTPAIVDLPPAPSTQHAVPFASIRGLSGRPMGLVAHPDQTPPSGGASSNATGLPAPASTESQP